MDQLSFAKLSQLTLSGMENGTGNQSLSTLTEISDVLGMARKTTHTDVIGGRTFDERLKAIEG